MWKTQSTSENVVFVVNHDHELGVDGTIVYFRVPLNEVATEFKERVSADCAEMKGWTWWHRASYNVKVHATVALYGIKVRRGYVRVCISLQGHPGGFTCIQRFLVEYVWNQSF